MGDAVARFMPDVVYLPAHLRNPSLLDRVRRNTLSALMSAIDAPVRLVEGDGAVSEA